MPHQVIEFAHPTTPRESPARRVTISVKQHWQDSWTVLPQARLDFAIWSCAPSMPRAQFSARYGWGMLAGQNQFSYIAPLAVGRWYVRIDIVQSTYAPDDEQVRWEDNSLATWEDGTPMHWEPEEPLAWDFEDDETRHEWEDGEQAAWEGGPSANAVPSWRWYGVIEVTADQQSATPTVGAIGVPSGDRTYLAYGLESLLERHRINTSEWKGLSDDLASAFRTSKGGMTFNAGGRGNRSGVMVRDRHYFLHWETDEFAAANRWSTRDIVRYLIRSMSGVPMSTSTDTDVMNFMIAAAELNRLPDWDYPEVESHLVSGYEMLNTLINRRRLLTWWLEVDEPLGVIRIRVATMTDVPIELLSPGGTIEANTNTVEFSFDKHFSADVTWQADTSHSIDQVIAYGARRTTTFTALFGFGLTSDHFRRAWTNEQEDEYELAGSDQPGYPAEEEVAERRRWHSLYRSQDSVRNVYSKWELNPYATFPPGDADDYEAFYGAVRLLTYIPLSEGVSYSSTTPDSETTNRRRPLVILEVPDQAGKYVSLTEIGRNGETEPRSEADVRDWSATIRIPKDGRSFTVDVAGAPQHTLAFDDFQPLPEDEVTHGHWNWPDMKATVAITDDRFAEGRYPADDDVASLDAKRTIRIQAGSNYRLDYLASDTIVDLGPDGTPFTVLAGTYTRDDRPKLVQIAKAAYQWYSRQRNAIRVRWPWDDQAGQLRLGQYITAMSQNEVSQPVGSLITQLEVTSLTDFGEEPRLDMPPMTTSIHTSFGELDYLRLRAVGAKGKKKEAKA